MRKKPRVPRNTATTNDMLNSMFVQLPLPETEQTRLRQAVGGLSADDEYKLRLHQLIRNIDATLRLLRKLDKPGVGLGQKWRVGMLRYYARVVNDQLTDLLTLTAEIESRSGSGKEKKDEESGPVTR